MCFTAEKPESQRCLLTNGIGALRALLQRVGHSRPDFLQKVARPESCTDGSNVLPYRGPRSSAFVLTSFVFYRKYTSNLGLHVTQFCLVDLSRVANFSKHHSNSNLTHETSNLVFSSENIVACVAVAMQRPRDERVYRGRFWAAAR
jgi:hypothetical protein